MVEAEHNTIVTGSKNKNREVVASLRNIHKSFGDQHVLRGVDMDLYAKENLVILGKSGTGKSVLIKCMIGLLTPDEGKINVLGYDVPNLDDEELDDYRSEVGFSFQGSALYDAMTIRENLEFPLKRNLKITDQKKLDERVVTALREVGLEDAINKMPSEISGGMKKRIGIARTLILKPKITLYDEPTAGLDPVTATEINELILEMRDKHKMASIIITHDISSARATADRIIALFDGKNELEGTFEELKAKNDERLAPFFQY